MLRFPGERIVVTVSPAFLRMERRHGWRRTRVMAQDYQGCTPLPGEPLWAAAVRCLDDTLQNTAWQHGDLEIRLSHHLVRYAVIPWVKGLDSDAEHHAFALHQLVRIYGAEAEEWELCLGEARDGQNLLACATDAQLVAEFKAVAARARRRLLGIAPMLNQVFNPLIRRLNGAPVCLIVQEPGKLLMALVRSGEWQAIRNLSVDDGWHEAVPSLVRQFCLSQGEAVENVALYLATLEEDGSDFTPWEPLNLDARNSPPPAREG